MNSKRNNNLDKTKITRFSIRTYKGYGAASIIVSAFFLLLNHNHIAQASEIKKDMNTSTNISHINSEVSSQLQSNNNLQNKNDTILNDANTVSNVQLNNTSTDSNKSLANKLADQHTQQNNVEDTKQNQSSINTQHNSQSPSVRHRIRKRSVNTNLAPASNNDPLHFNETNTSIENGHFDHVTGGTLPTTSQKVTVVTGVDHWTSLSTAPNPEFPIFNTLTAKDYRPFMSDASAPYGVVLARTTDGNNRNVLDPKVAGIYQDISVVPGSELVVRFTSASMTFKSSVTGAKLKISDTTGSQILFDSRLNGMGNFPTGKLTVLVNIPENLNRVRVMFLPISNKSNLTSGQTSSANGFGSAPANIYYGGVVSNVSVNSGAYIETSVPQTSYTVSANSATANAVRATVSFNLENKGHNFAKSVDYKVTLPANSKFISATGAQGSYNQATNVLTLSIGQVGIGQRRTITYTTELQATEPKNVELNGNLTYQTDAPFRGTGIQKTGNNSVNTQTVQILMYQTDLQTKVNDVTQQLHTLNEADYTPESWNALKAKLVDANNILNEENNHIDLANRQNQATINQLTTDIQTLFTQLKETTPASPSVTADVPNANVVVSPQGDTTSMTIKYVDTAGTDQSITAMKANNMWSLNPTVAGISINDQTGTVTVEHTAVQPNSVVKATAVKGNSDSSNEMQVTMPIKEATPAPPTVTADEPTASVVITPQGEITSMTIKYVDTAGADQSITATKANNIWSLNPSVQGITINDQTGIVNVNHTAVQPHSEVKATAVKGNSNVSGENKAEIPVKQVTPLAPTITADVSTAIVLVSPQGDTTSMTIKYVDTAGADQTITATKVNNMWSLNPTVAGMSINDQTGTVTVEHTAVQPNSVVKATAVKGNSDSSSETRVTMPIKEATPAPPTVTADEPTASVVVSPQGDITSMTIKYVDTARADQTITATKINNMWSLNPSVAGMTINDQSGAVTISHTAVQASSEVKATAVKGNSDSSSETRVMMPIKQATPAAPTVAADIPHASVVVTPQGDVTSMTIKYTDMTGANQSITVTKANNIWSLNPSVAGMTINDQSGAVTISHTAVQASSEVIATAVKGNSDVSGENKAEMPVKEATPVAPTVIADVPTASVVVTPQGDITSMTIKYVDTVGTDQIITATKINNMWSLNPSVAGISINNQTGTVTVTHTAVQPHSEVKATAVKGNSDSSSETQVTMPIKETMPTAPTVTADVPTASVVITPQGDITSMTIKYVDTTGADQTITVTKANNMWSLNPSVAGISINNQTGTVTVTHTAVQPHSEVKATAVKGNSDVSGENKDQMPIKEATPAPPNVTADVPTASVVITPQGDITSMTIKYVDTAGTNQTITATKTNNTWSLSSLVQGVSINNQSGVVTVAHTAVQASSEVKATAVKGNSDSSSETQVTMPIKEATPAAPSVTADVPTASVIITPQGDITSMTIKYINPASVEETIMATKNGSTWDLSNTVGGITINNQTGIVTVDHTAVQASSEIKATAVKGNSDVSGENKDQMPIKEATPAAPTVTADMSTASVVITPQGDITSMTIKYVDTAGTDQITTATKVNNTWSLNPSVQGISINDQTGIITVEHTAVQPSSEVKATAVKGNSDSSSETQVTMPVKEATPAPPNVTADEPTASVVITPQGDITSMTIKYVDTAGTDQTISATKANNIWSLNPPVAGMSINDRTGAVTVEHTAVQPNSEVKATAVKGNSDSSSETQVTIPVKEATPASPTVTADEPTASVVITPQGDITSMTIKYVDTAGTDQTISATKANNIWSLNPPVAGISINDQSGVVTVSYTAVQASSEVKATAVKGNSDSSNETRVMMPIKEATPLPPNVTADEPTASVVITPQGDTSAMTINYVDTAGTDKTITVTKENNTWSLNPSVQGISINDQTGIVTVEHTAVQPNSEVKVTAIKGNSDVSGENKAEMPIKETTPTAPSVTADVSTASVVVSPQGDTSAMTINYVDTTGADQSITATKANNMWSLNPSVAGISINNQTGVVTVEHTAVQISSEIKATAIKGNSDVSGENKAGMPIKEATPASPTVTADEPTASVVITPQGDITSMTIKYVDTAGTDQTISATKANNIWSLNPPVQGISIDSQTGVVDVDHTAVQPHSEVIATAVKGNSDSSSETQVTMPIKEGTPAAPTVTADEATASVVVTPQGDTSAMTIEYTDTTGADQSITATNVNNLWSLKSTVPGISINNQTGVVTVDHTAVQPHSDIIATAVKGNSDVSEEHTVQMPIKEATPTAPIVAADEATASVVVTPQGDTGAMTIEYTDTTGADQSITATKVNNVWSFNPSVQGITINNQTGVVTIDHTAVQPHSEVTATAVKGNSDVSEEHTVQMPIKETTPAAPTVTADEATASVTITPQGDTTSMTIKYVDTTGAGQTITATKVNNMWSLNPSVAGISINNQTGVVTVDHTAVQLNSAVNVFAVNKNSNPSQTASMTMNDKMPTPQTAAIIEEDTDQHITMVRPPENVNQLMIEIDNTDASTFTINAVKQQNEWQLVNNQYPSVHINPKTGEVTIPGDIAQFEGTITATVKNGNSDGKSVTQTLASEKFDDETLPILHVTVWVDTEGNILKDPVEDDKNPEEAKEVGSFKGYQYIGMEMKDGITRYIFKKLNSVPQNNVNQAANPNNNQENHHTSIINQNNENHSLQANNQSNDTGNNQQTPTIQNNEHNNSQDLSSSNVNNTNHNNKAPEDSSQQDNHSGVISKDNNSVHGSDLTHAPNNTGTTSSTGHNEPLISTSQPEDGINAIQQDLPVLHVTVWMDTKGQILKDPIEDDKYPKSARQAGEIPGYRFLETKVKDGITIHIFEKLSKNRRRSQSKTQLSTDKETLTNIINQPITKVKKEEEVLTVSHNNSEQVTKKEDKKNLPQAGQVNDDNHSLMYALMSLLGLSLIFRRKHKERQ